ncbi:MAG: TauD/TfdA family dioxygenase [Rhizonema sp. PD37]|nr:TauD/TfdA family dioxygenase [Rhizonema sp. PD37]
MTSKIESFGISTGKIVHSIQDFQDILNLSVPDTNELFKSSGCLLFRGFGVTHEQMKTFAKQFSSKFIQDYTRPQVNSDQFVHFVDPGMDNCLPHSEHAYSPFRPDVIWFCCAVPAAEGGETLFWDGVRVWEELSQESKQLFLSKKLKFCYNNIPFDLLKRFASSDATIVDIKQILDGFEGVTYKINGEQTISMEYVCSAVVKTKYGNQNAFANTFWATQKKTEEAIFEDGSRAPDEVVDEIEKVLNKLTEEISWQAGDLVMMDNSRFLHGRRAFNDTRRQVFSTLSNLNF